MDRHMTPENYTNINIFKKVFEHAETPSADNVTGHKQKEAAAYGGNKQHHSQFNPYTNNQGTVLGKHKKCCVEWWVNQIL